MLALILEPEIERRVAERAKSRSISDADFVRALIEASLDDLDDVQMAVERLDHRLPPLTGAEAHKALGLDSWIRSESNQRPQPAEQGSQRKHRPLPRGSRCASQ
jgi:predicted DNA-binding protein